MNVASPLKWHGGKSYLTKKIIGVMPPHLTFCEPFAGGLSVMLSKNPDGISEVANDINRSLSEFWDVLRDPALFELFRRKCEATPFSEVCFDECKTFIEESQPPELTESQQDPAEVRVQRVWAFFVYCRQSLAGRMNAFAPLSKTRIRRRMNEQVSAWLSGVDGLPEVHARLKRVAIMNRPAVKVIRHVDAPTTLFYCDPPYLKETRATPDVYHHEMSTDDHTELLQTLAKIEGKFILSGYRSELYREFEQRYRWHRTDIEIDNKAAAGVTKRKMIESLWMNYDPTTI